MRIQRLLGTVAVLALVIAGVVAARGGVVRADAEADAFQRTWQRTDKPVADGAVSRTWMWGPQQDARERTEDYAESPGGRRTVLYFDKSRMEITDPAGDQGSVWYVTNGLLVVELMTGRMQTGDSTFVDREPARINVAGDPGSGGITYARLAALRDAAPLADGAAIVWRLALDGSTTPDPALAAYGAVAAQRVTVPGVDHQVASPFWAFMNASGTVWQDGGFVEAALFENPFYATGLPITEAYWTTVQVGGQPRDVLLQCFERRCLTWTPANPAGWQVEAGNVGLHYHAWRYGNDPSETPTAEPSETPTSTPPVDDGIPDEAATLYTTDFTDWDVITNSGGDAAWPSGGEYHVRAYRGGSLYSFGDTSFGTAAYAVDMRREAGFSDARGCLVLRAEQHPTAPTVPRHAYDACVTFDDGVASRLSLSWVEVQDTPNGPQSQSVELASFAIPGSPAANDWTHVKVIASGKHFWLFANGSYLGQATHDDALDGLIGLAASAPLSAESATVAFRALTVKAVE